MAEEETKSEELTAGEIAVIQREHDQEYKDARERLKDIPHT